MKWSYKYVWEKVESIVPGAKEWGYDLPEALKVCAVELFLSGEGSLTGSYRAYVIEQALLELRRVGWLEFGSVDEDWK